MSKSYVVNNQQQGLEGSMGVDVDKARWGLRGVWVGRFL